ncbi:hypothetical protein [Chamaesiphon sp. VAR_69_metabat_338]|nr:hypothetical protein [Chamaesiphon sp. VAR_69_metabat_338]
MSRFNQKLATVALLSMASITVAVLIIANVSKFAPSHRSRQRTVR